MQLNFYIPLFIHRSTIILQAKQLAQNTILHENLSSWAS